MLATIRLEIKRRIPQQQIDLHIFSNATHNLGCDINLEHSLTAIGNSDLLNEPSTSMRYFKFTDFITL